MGSSLRPADSRLARFFTLVIAGRWYVLACYALLLPPSAYFAARDFDMPAQCSRARIA